MRIRLPGVLLALVLGTSAAFANPNPLPFEIVRMLPETQQVLVFDRAHNTHVLLQPGAKFEDYTVVSITGIDMVVEKAQERFVVYPREAKFLALTVLPRDQNTPQPPVIYGKSAPVAPAPTQAIATTDAKVVRPATLDAKAQAAQALALVLADTQPRATPRTQAPSLTKSPTIATPGPSSKLKP